MASAQVATIDLPESLDLNAADEVRAQLLERIGHDPVAVNASAVQRVATNALLMLLSAAHSAKRRGSGLVFAVTSSGFDDAVAKLGLQAAFAPFRMEEI